MSRQASDSINIRPTPRVLRMLGEIDLPAEKCFAEFIDNALDEGIDGKPGRGSTSESGETLRVEIETPTRYEYDDNYDNAKIIVRDNGPGMAPRELEKNLRAGYSGKDPIDELGLFGMGFNVATARLGSRTTVKTTQAGQERWALVTIDFRELEANNSYELDVEFEDKKDPSDHGTEIIIEQLEEISRTLRHKSIDEELGDMYTPVIENENISIILDGDEISSKPHCTWNKDRSVEISGEEFPAHIPIDEKVGEAYYCKTCWNWWEDRFVENEREGEDQRKECPACGDKGDLEHRDQRVYGWVGIQRFFDQRHFGIDLIRNGRVIEKHDKSFFYWENPKTGEKEKEYPIDTTHWGGRIVGELHIDFVPVTNVKDGFRKENERWEKVREAVRGEGPFRPTYASDHGYEPNRSPLGKLFKGYRTGNEAGKKRLVPGKVTSDGKVEAINAEPQRWAEKFWEGVPEYQDDTKWWKAVEKAEEAKRSSSSSTSTTKGDTKGSDKGESGFNFDPEADQDSQRDDGTEEEEEMQEGKEDISEEEKGEQNNKVPEKEEDNEGSKLNTETDDDISQTYGLDRIDQPDIEILAQRVISGNLGGSPVEVKTRKFNEKLVRYDPSHEVFTGFGHSPIDAVLMEVASTFLARMDDPGSWTQSRLYAELKSKYCSDKRLTPETLASRATKLLQKIRQRIAEEKYSLNEHEIPSEVRSEVERKFLRKTGKAGADVKKLFESSAYLEFSSNDELIRYFKENPSQFFDGTVWERAFSGLASEDLKERSKSEFLGYLEDARMLAEEALERDVEGMRASTQIELERAAMSLKIIEKQSVL